MVVWGAILAAQTPRHKFTGPIGLILHQSPMGNQVNISRQDSHCETMRNIGQKNTSLMKHDRVTGSERVAWSWNGG
jgi:hypothetical protein